MRRRRCDRGRVARIPTQLPSTRPRSRIRAPTQHFETRIPLRSRRFRRAAGAPSSRSAAAHSCGRTLNMPSPCSCQHATCRSQTLIGLLGRDRPGDTDVAHHIRIRAEAREPVQVRRAPLARSARRGVQSRGMSHHIAGDRGASKEWRGALAHRGARVQHCASDSRPLFVRTPSHADSTRSRRALRLRPFRPADTVCAGRRRESRARQADFAHHAADRRAQRSRRGASARTSARRATSRRTISARRRRATRISRA